LKAIVFAEPHKLEVRDIPLPEIGPDEVLIRPRRVGICRSDFDLLMGEYILPLHWPITPGHEYVGEIVEVGSDVVGYEVGDRVVGECAVGCGTCDLCASGLVNACPTGDHFGFTIDGAMAEYTKVRAAWLHKLPDNIGDAEGALIEPFTVGYFSVMNIGGVNAADTVVILGAGVIGLCTLIAAHGMNARTILVDTKQNRLELGRELGADHLVNAAETDMVSAVLELTGDKGADAVIECVGADPLMQRLFDFVRSAGRVSITGINFNDELAVPLHKIQAKALTVKGNIGSPLVWRSALRFLSRTEAPLGRLATQTFGLDDAAEAFRIADDPSQSIKVQFIP
jgi:L-iditol 2-dehydrogenase